MASIKGFGRSVQSKLKRFLQRILQEIMKKKILGTSDPWSMSRLSQRDTEPVYYSVDYRISNLPPLPLPNSSFLHLGMKSYHTLVT